MNDEQISGKPDQVGGKIKQGVGEAFGNQDLANRGLADQVKGAAKETMGNVKDAAHQTAQDHANRSRENLSDGVENAKNRINEKIEATRDR